MFRSTEYNWNTFLASEYLLDRKRERGREKERKRDREREEKTVVDRFINTNTLLYVLVFSSSFWDSCLSQTLPPHTEKKLMMPRTTNKQEKVEIILDITVIAKLIGLMGVDSELFGVNLLTTIITIDVPYWSCHQNNSHFAWCGRFGSHHNHKNVFDFEGGKSSFFSSETKQTHRYC